jgi:plasmid stability protein
MSTLHVRNVPETLHERLQALARADGRSLNAQVLTLLARAVRESPSLPGVEEILARARRIRAERSARRRGPSSLTLLREGRRERGR